MKPKLLKLTAIVALAHYQVCAEEFPPEHPSGGREGRPSRSHHEGRHNDGRPPRGGPKPMMMEEYTQDPGAQGIVWYPVLEDGVAEAKRSNRPMLFMAAASQCDGVSGVF